MKKIFLLAALIFIIAIARAQQPQARAYAFPSVILTDAIIAERIEESRKKGVQEWELEHLKQGLTKLMKSQQYNLAHGNDLTQRTVPPQVQAGCTNIDFENGTNSGWTQKSADINYVTLPCNTCPTGSGGIGAITSATNSGACWTAGVDGCSGQPAVAPGGGNYSYCMNDMTCGGKMQQIQQTFMVGASNNVFTYQYLAVLQDGGHASTDQPYFMSRVLDGSNNVIPCTYVLQSASASITGWTASSSCASTNYKGWVTVTLDLTSYIGQNVTIEFLISDCNQGGHFGYCYIDASCNQIQTNNTVTVCPPSTQLCGPSGFNTYSWSGPVTGNAMCLPGATAGAYTLVTTGQCPAPTRYYTVTVAPVPTLSVNSPTICAGGSGASLAASGAVSYTWSPATGLSSTTSGTVTANPATTTTYTLTGASAGGCTSSVTTVVTVSGSASVTVNSPSICPGNTVTLTASGASTYTWSPAGSLSASTGASVVASPTATTVYTINASSAGGCTATGTATVTIGGTLAPTVNSPSYCAGGSATLTAAGGTTYTWSPAGGLSGTSGPSVTASPTVTTTYTVNAASGGCTGSVTAVVTVNPKPTVTATGNSICNGAGPVNITGGGAATYTWDSGSTANPQSVNPASTTNYTVTGASAAGCTNTATCTVIVTANPTITVANTSICAGQTATLTANSNAATFAWAGSNLITSTGSVVTANPAATSAYTIIGSVGTCTVSTTATITINPNIVPTFTASTVCQGQPTQLTSTTAGVTSYTWDYGDGGGSTTIANPTETYSAAGTYVASYSVVNASGCTGNTTATITVNANPVPAFTSSTPCQGTAVAFTNNTPASPIIANWGWAFGDGQSSTLQTPTNNYAAAGIYTTTLLATSISGCTTTATGTVAVHPNPVASFATNTVCLNTPPTQFTDASSLVNPAGITDNITTYAWSFGDGNISATAGNVINSYASCGNFNASLTVVTNNMCTNTFTLPVTVNCVPVLTPPASPTVCPNTAVAPGAFAIDIPGSTPTWTASTTVTGVGASGIGNVPGYTTMTPNLTGGNISDVITAIPTSGAGCIGLPKTFTITVKPTPLMNPMSDITVCDQGTINVAAFGSFPAGSTFAWANGNTTIGLGAAGAGNIAPFTGLSNGSPTAVVSTVSVTPTLNGCVGPDSTFVITISPQPTVTLTSPPFTCPGNLVPAPTYTMNPNDPATTFTWANNNGATGLAMSGGPTISGSFTASPNGTLANVVSVVTVTPALGTCIGLPATYTVTILPTPVINSIPSVEYCPGVNTSAINISMIPVNGGAQSYNWSAPTGSNIGMTTTNGNTNVVPSFNTAGAAATQTSQVIVSASLDGCPALPITFDMTVNPNPVATFSASPKICLGTPMSFYDGSSVGSGSVTQWAWDFNNDNVFGDAVTQNPQFVFTTAGSHTVGLQVTTNKGCKADTTFPVYINYMPVPQFTGDVLSGCPQHPVNFTESSTVTGPASITNWGWSFGNGTTFSTQTAGTNPPTVIYDNIYATTNVYYSVSLQVTTDSGCTSMLTYTNYITVFAHPIAGFAWNPTDADIDNPTINFIDQSLGASGPSADYGALGIKWDLGDVYGVQSDNISYIKYPVHAYLHEDPFNNTQTYTVTQWVENSQGCKDSIKKVVEILPTFAFYIPNAFSPNGDGTNDGFKGTGIGVDNDTYNLWVFDRWGMQVFYTNDMEKTWDGKIQGKGGDIVQEDVYVWKVKFKDFMGRKHEYKGTVSVIK